jgi:O-antigen/teichoic acid export membrane protein
MKSGARRLTSNSAIYGVGAVSQKLLVFALIPLYTRVISQTQYGIVAVVNAVIPLLAVVSSFALQGAVVRHYHKYSGQSRRLARYLSSVLTCAVAIGVTVVVAAIAAGASLVDPGKLGLPLFPHLFLVVLAAFFLGLSNVVNAKNMAAEKALHYIGVDNGREFATACLGVLLVGFLGREALGHIEAKLAGAILGLIIAAPALRDYGDVFAARIEDAAEAFRFSLPLVPHLAATWALSSADRILLVWLGTEAQAGIYDVGYRATMPAYLVMMALGRAWTPFYYDLAKSGGAENRKRLGIMIQLLLALITLSACGSILYGDEIVRIVGGPRYEEATVVVAWVAAGFVALSFYDLFNRAIFFAEKTRYMPALSIGAVVANVGLNILLIPRWGIVGAAVATLLAYLALGAAGYFLSQRIHSVPFSLRSFVLIVLTVLVATGVAGIGNELETVAGLAVKTVGLVACGLILVVGDIMSRKSLVRIWDMFRNMLRSEEKGE